MQQPRHDYHEQVGVVPADAFQLVVKKSKYFDRVLGMCWES